MRKTARDLMMTKYFRDANLPGDDVSPGCPSLMRRRCLRRLLSPTTQGQYVDCTCAPVNQPGTFAPAHGAGSSRTVLGVLAVRQLPEDMICD